MQYKTAFHYSVSCPCVPCSLYAEINFVTALSSHMIAVFPGVLKPPASSPSGMPPPPVSSQYGANIQQNGAHPHR